MSCCRRKHSFLATFSTCISTWTLVCFHMNKSVAECMRIEKGTFGQISIAANLTTLSYRYCLIWTSTRDQILRKCNYPRKYRYGLQLDLKQKPAHLLLLILLAGDVATNPGPPKSGRNFVNCLVINARNLKSRHFVNGRKLCHLSCFQDLVYSEQVDLVWVTETWLTDDVHKCEILTSFTEKIGKHDRVAVSC